MLGCCFAALAFLPALLLAFSVVDRRIVVAMAPHIPVVVALGAVCVAALGVVLHIPSRPQLALIGVVAASTAFAYIRAWTMARSLWILLLLVLGATGIAALIPVAWWSLAVWGPNVAATFVGILLWRRSPAPLDITRAVCAASVCLDVAGALTAVLPFGPGWVGRGGAIAIAAVQVVALLRPKTFPLQPPSLDRSRRERGGK